VKEVKASNKAVVTVGCRNRINIPAGLLSAAGMVPNKKITCFSSEKTKQLMLVVSNVGAKPLPGFQGNTFLAWQIVGDYSVCNDGRLKVGHGILSTAGLGKVTKLLVSVEGKGVLKVTKVK
jgi:hypothetical protein